MTEIIYQKNVFVVRFNDRGGLGFDEGPAAFLDEPTANLWAAKQAEPAHVEVREFLPMLQRQQAKGKTVIVLRADGTRQVPVLDYDRTIAKLLARGAIGGKP